MFDWAGNTSDGLLIGLGGNDVIIADYDYFFISGEGDVGIDITTYASPWSTAENDTILNSTVVPHASIFYEATAADQPFWKVTATANSQITLDIDFGAEAGNFDTDTVVEIYAADGVTLLASNDDAGGDPGSPTTADSFLQYLFAAAGTYFIRVKEYDGPTDPDANFEAGDNFVLNVSLENQAVTNGDPVAGNDTLYGGDGNDSLFGNGGDDTFFAGAGADEIHGGTGIDIVSYGDAHYGNLVISMNDPTANTGAAFGDKFFGIEGIIGGSGSDLILGNDQDNILDGGGGDDTILGDFGTDRIRGGAGADIVVVQLAAQFTSGESVDGGAGTADRIRFTSGVTGETLVLSDQVSNVEIIEIAAFNGAADGVDRVNLNAAAMTYGTTLRGNDGNNSITGSAFGDTIEANAGADTINGGAGSDTIRGNDGNDVIQISAAAHHTTTELIDGGVGTTDRIRFTSTTSGETLKLSNQVINVEIVEITTSTGSTGGTTTLNINAASLTYGVTINGNSGVNTLTGSAFVDTINGGAGADILNGGGGSDILDGGAGNDVFRFANSIGASNIDTISNYVVADDRFELDNAYFTALTDGWLFSSAFAANTTGLATTTSQRIIYETDTGKLFYDSNGSAAGGTYQQFAQLAAGLSMTASEFLVI